MGDAYKRLFQRLPPSTISMTDRGPLRVLDCGIGAGNFSLALAQSIQGDVSLTGVDVSPEMLREAANTLCGIRSLSLREADARQLPFADSEFDMVMAAHVLEHLPDPDAALSEMMRVLKPGGKLLFCITRRSVFGFYVHLNWRTQFKSIPWWRDVIRRQDGVRIEKIVDDMGGAFSNMSFAVFGAKES